MGKMSCSLVVAGLAIVIPNVVAVSVNKDTSYLELKADPGNAVKNTKCTTTQIQDAVGGPCNDCGCTECPCCISGNCDFGTLDYAPTSGLAVETTANCSLGPSPNPIKDWVTDGPNDPLACAIATGNVPSLSNANDPCPDLSKADCTSTTGSLGNLCMWYAFEGGKCVMNTCSDVNDGSCTIAQTGGRCVWYGKPGSLKTRTVNGVNLKEMPNPYRAAAGCYKSPCNNPVENNARGCEELNSPQTAPSGLDYGYKCQWCYTQTVNGNGLGCQNVQMDSFATPRGLSGMSNQGTAPCVNPFCNFFTVPNLYNKGTVRTNNAKVFFDEPIMPGNNWPEQCPKGGCANVSSQYSWVDAFGNATTPCSCGISASGKPFVNCSAYIPNPNAYQ